MIEIVARNGPPEALLCAAFICDGCRQQVVREGNLLYVTRYVGEDRESSPLLVSHKTCTLRVEVLLAHFYPSADGWLDCSEEISDFIRHLTGNLRRSFASDQEGTYPGQHIVLPVSGSVGAL